MSGAPYRILLVCSGNTCRSSMAEALLRQLISEDWPAGQDFIEVRSAGTMAYPGAPASEHAVDALRERGLDLTAHRATQLNAASAGQASLILTMTRSHKAQVQQLLEESAEAGARPPVFTLREYAHPDEPAAQWDVMDPFGADLVTYQKTADELAEVLRRVVARLRSELEVR